MPQLGETVTEGTITRWLKAEGDAVAVDESLFEVSTDKVDTEVPSAFGGFLRRILVREGDTVPIHAVLALITGTSDEPIPDRDAMEAKVDVSPVAGPITPSGGDGRSANCHAP